MKSFFIIFILILNILIAEEKKIKPEQSLRSKIGPTVRLPLLIKDKYYFLTGGGVLVRASKEFKNEEILFKTKFSTVSPLVKKDNLLIFGEGLHDHKETSLYIFDIKEEKLVKQIKIEGHIQRSPIFNDSTIYVGAGFGGLIAINLEDYSIKWRLTKFQKEELHVDSNPIIYKDLICFTSVYKAKGIYCSNNQGEIIVNIDQEKNPKGELVLVKNKLVAQATEATMQKLKFDIPSVVTIIDLDKKKKTHEIKLRGFNFFQPLKLNETEVMFNLSTGDMITLNVNSGKIGYIGEFPEPFVSTPFKYEDSVCSLGLMGKLICKEKGEDQYVITKEKRFFESPVGEIGSIGDKVISVSRMGYFEIN